MSFQSSGIVWSDVAASVPLAEMTALIGSRTGYRHLILTEQMQARMTTAQERCENGILSREKRERRLRSRPFDPWR